MTLIARPIIFRDAVAYVRAHHRHNDPPRGWKFGVACAIELTGQTLQRASCGRRDPVARELDDGWTLEVNRTCTSRPQKREQLLVLVVQDRSPVQWAACESHHLYARTMNPAHR